MTKYALNYHSDLNFINKCSKIDLKLRTRPSVKDKLKKLNITEARYTAEFSALQSKGYDEGQIHRLILRKSSKATIKALIAHHETLVSLGLSTGQIVKIASHSGGSRNIDAVKSAHAKLKESGFSAEQIVKIAGHNGGSNTTVVIH